MIPMIASAFDEETDVLGPPSGMAEEDVYSLSVWRGKDSTGESRVISCWKLTREELELINKTGRVWLHVLGDTMPPVCLEVAHPFK